MRHVLPAGTKASVLTAACCAAAAAAGMAGATLKAPSWSRTLSSPHPAPVTASRDAPLLELCASGDAALHEVALRAVRGELPDLGPESLADELRRAGDPHVWPRAWSYRAKPIDRIEAAARLRAWLASSASAGERRCGIASTRDGDGREAIVVVTLDAQADLRSVPSLTRPGGWIRLDATSLVPAYGAKVVVLGPDGPPHSIPTSFSEGRIQATFSADRPGKWLAQILLDGPSGPRPVLEAMVFAGTDLPAISSLGEVPGEDAGGAAPNPRAALAAMITAARDSEALPSLAEDRELDGLALRHSETMMKRATLAHDAGDGDPQTRTGDLRAPASRVGENIAHAATVALAHRVLWSSPSHRQNLLDPRFERLGVGVARGPDGTLWVTELFASH